MFLTLDIVLKDGDDVDTRQIKNLKGAKDDRYSEVGIFVPRTDSYFYKIQKHGDKF